MVRRSEKHIIILYPSSLSHNNHLNLEYICFIFKHSLAVLDAVIRYSSLPSTALHSFVVAVCNTVNVEKFCQPSWRVSEYNDTNIKDTDTDLEFGLIKYSVAYTFGRRLGLLNCFISFP